MNKKYMTPEGEIITQREVDKKKKEEQTVQENTYDYPSQNIDHPDEEDETDHKDS